MLYLLTFFFGFPFTFALVFQFDVQVVPPSALLQALLASVSFYAIYYVAYKTRLRRPDAVYSGTPLFSMNKTETRSPGCCWRRLPSRPPVFSLWKTGCCCLN